MMEFIQEVLVFFAALGFTFLLVGLIFLLVFGFGKYFLDN